MVATQVRRIGLETMTVVHKAMTDGGLWFETTPREKIREMDFGDYTEIVRGIL